MGIGHRGVMRILVRKVGFRLCVGAVLVWLLGGLLVRFSGSSGGAKPYRLVDGDDGTATQEALPLYLDLWALSHPSIDPFIDALPSVGSQQFIYGKQPISVSQFALTDSGEGGRIVENNFVKLKEYSFMSAVVRIGFPLDAFRYTIAGKSNAGGDYQWTHHGALGISGKYIPGLESWRTLTIPLMPVFPGFIVDVLFWGLFAWAIEYVIRGVLFVLKFLLGINRRKLRATRRANNQCISCGYPRGEFDTCPECGSAVEPLAMSGD